MLSNDSDTVWRCVRLGRLAAWSFIVLAAVSVVSGLIVGLLSVVRGDASGVGKGVLIAVIFAPAGLFGWRCGLHPFLAASPDGLTVRNPLQTLRIPWDHVARCSPGSSGIRLTMKDGTTVTAWAVQKSNLFQWFHRRTRADEVADEIERLARRST